MLKYAMLDEGNIVIYIGTQQEKDNTEKGTVWVPIPEEEVQNVKLGYQWRPDLNKFERVRLSLPKEKARLLDLNIQIYIEKMTFVLQGYDYYEIMTFPYQTQDLLSYRQIEVGERAELLFLPALCDARGIPLNELIPRLEKKIKQFAYISGYLTGMKQKFEERIELSDRYEYLDEIEKHLKIWRKANLLG